MAENQARSTSICPPEGERDATCIAAPHPNDDRPSPNARGRGKVLDPSTASRRAIVGLLIGALVVGVLCILDYLPALYAAVVLGHVVVALRWQG